MSASSPAAHPRRRAWAVVSAAALAASGLMLLPASPAHAAPVVLQPGELVVNGDAEQPADVGWSSGLVVRPHGSGGYPDSVIVGPGGLTGETYDGGASLFSGSGASSVSTQVIDLTPSAAAIDNGNVDALLSAYVGGYLTQQDNAQLSYEFQDGSGGTIDTVTFGPVMSEDRGGVSGFVPFADTVRLASGTRTVVITITTSRSVAPANDGYVDNVSLILDAPDPVATPDTATTEAGVAVTMTPPSNDTPGTGAEIVPQSVRLLDGATPVTNLTTAEGTYVVDTATGNVTFTPAAGFEGTTTPVSYLIGDSSGQQAQATLTIVVTPPELAETGTEATGAIAVAGAIALTGIIVLLAGRRRRA